MPTVVLRVLALVVFLALPAPARGYVIYDSSAGFYPANFLYIRQQSYDGPVAVDTFDFSYDGALCPAPGTENFLCARAHAAAGNNSGRIYLRAGARMTRTNAQFTQEHGVYAQAHVDIGPMGGYVTGPAPGAYFVFGLSGTLASASSTAAVTVNSYAVANLYAGSGSGVQCFGTTCPPSAHHTLKVSNWDPAEGLSLDLRTD